VTKTRAWVPAVRKRHTSFDLNSSILREFANVLSSTEFTELRHPDDDTAVIGKWKTSIFLGFHQLGIRFFDVWHMKLPSSSASRARVRASGVAKFNLASLCSDVTYVYILNNTKCHKACGWF
jgi:hypothetical protein